MTYPLICLDAEFTENNEILQLGVIDSEGNEIYNDYFKPAQSTRWRTDIHHITPEMVADKPSFDSCRPEVQRLFDDASILMGFALSNDIKVLAKEGVSGLENKPVLDIRDLFWFVRGRNSNMQLDSVPSLIACAHLLGLDFNEEAVHSASIDAALTLRCFDVLKNEFCSLYYDEENPADIVAQIMERVKKEKEAYRRERASGYVKVVSHPKGYRLKFSYSKETDKKEQVLEVRVEDRYKAEYELRKLLKKKENPMWPGVYRLAPKQLEEIAAYRNQYSADESSWYRKVVKNPSVFLL